MPNVVHAWKLDRIADYKKERWILVCQESDKERKKEPLNRRHQSPEIRPVQWRKLIKPKQDRGSPEQRKKAPEQAP